MIIPFYFEYITDYFYGELFLFVSNFLSYLNTITNLVD